MMPKVSVCIPCYVSTQGRLNTLLESIDSVLKQTFRDFELWVIDDASPIQWYHEYKTADPRVHIIPERERRGLIGNVIRAMSYGKSPILKPMTDDDILDETYLEKTVPLVEQYGFVITAQCSSLEKFKQKAGDHRFPPGMFAENVHCLFPAQIFTREHYIALGGYDPETPIHFDYDFTVRSYFIAGGYLLNEALCFFREWPESTTCASRNIYTNFSESARTYRKLLGFSRRTDAILRWTGIKNALLAMATIAKNPRHLSTSSQRASLREFIHHNLRLILCSKNQSPTLKR